MEACLLLGRVDIFTSIRFRSCQMELVYSALVNPSIRACRLLRRADANHDGVLTIEELDTIVDFALARYKFRK